MSDNCFKKNDLLIPGTRHDERLLNALKPTYVLPDERSIADLLVFISKFAGLLNFYSIQSPDQKDYLIDGDWSPLISSDDAFTYAGISITPYTLPNVTFYKKINLYETSSTTLKRHEAYRVLWDILFSVYHDINAFYTALPVYMALRAEIATEISNGLAHDFGLVAGSYLNDNTAIPILNLQVSSSSADDEYKFGYADDIIHGVFDLIWVDEGLAPGVTSWPDYLGVLNLSPGLASDFFNVPALLDQLDRIDYSTLQLKQIFRRAFEAYTRIITKANEYLQNSLNHNSAHYAHHGLMLAFLKLFGVLTKDMNAFTRKHLEYYYSRVLRIYPAPAVADAAHIVFDPAKNSDSHLLPKATILNGGKDGMGKLLLYRTDEDITISQASISSLKTIFLKPQDTLGSVAKVYASVKGDSADGKGGAFTSDDISWDGFGDIRIDPVSNEEINLAALGFYIACPELHLTEGRRTVSFEFTTDIEGMAKAGSLTATDLKKIFSISFSGEKQWETMIIDDGVITDFNSKLQYHIPTASTFKIKMILLPHFNPILGYDPKVCDGNLNTKYPVVRFSLVQNAAISNAFEKLKGINITRIKVRTNVTGITGLSLQNELGELDPTKPVLPLGPSPKKGSSFFIGHPELQHKQITYQKVSLSWLEFNSDLRNHYAYESKNNTEYYVNVASNSAFQTSVSLIRNKKWELLNSSSSILSGSTTALSNTITALPKAQNPPETYDAETITFTPQTQNGFIRLVLNNPSAAFGHSIWPAVFAQQTVAYSNDSSENSIPNPPYTPTLESVRLQYKSICEINLTAGNDISHGQFFHLMPFGTAEHKSMPSLIPGFELEKKETDGSFSNLLLESAVYVGISHAIAHQQISILIQVNEGTEDISINPPIIIWNYLSTSGWKHFDTLFLADSTENLVKSGIVKFQVPQDIEQASTILPTRHLWIMAAIEPDFSQYPKISSNGLPRILTLHSNAVKATFSDQGNDPLHFTEALPAGTISKLFDPNAAIKKVNQPYASFGGKPIEAGDFFYTRVSERLRHKNRAITIWDYERLVLHEFPDVYMVKCLNHTGYVTDCATSTYAYKENIPGQVMLVPVPFVTNLQAGNIYTPTFSTARLVDIMNFIHGSDESLVCSPYRKALHCQLAALVVENPEYETIKVSCKVKIKSCFDTYYYESKLVDDLNIFLSPWITGDAGKIEFGGKLHASQVVYYIEQLSYIDYLESLTLEHKKGDIVLNTLEPLYAVATTSRSVLTSYGTHTIQKA
ncbi:MAG: hypothetical protein SH808_15190 [Saprospiraceae bacterium]|nr:hypothetical protein [Saprospiraceae bacterium]